MGHKSVINRNNAATGETRYPDKDPQNSSVGVIVIQPNSRNLYDRKHPSTMRIRWNGVEIPCDSNTRFESFCRRRPLTEELEGM